jgi:hypothetical protein
MNSHTDAPNNTGDKPKATRVSVRRRAFTISKPAAAKAENTSRAEIQKCMPGYSPSKISDFSLSPLYDKTKGKLSFGFVGGGGLGVRVITLTP